MLPTLPDYYQFNYKVNAGSATDAFDFALCLRRTDVFTGDGTDIGGGTDGTASLLAVAEGIARAIETTSAPYWQDIRVMSIDASPSAAVRLYSEPPGQ